LSWGWTRTRIWLGVEASFFRGWRTSTTSRAEIVFDSASALRASALDTAHVPEYCMRALDVRA
jgi:hypothetical protein